MNRFKIISGKEETFEEIWKSRDTHLENVPGFKKFNLIKGSKKDTTNNQMELLAPIKALKKIAKGSKVQIFTDSKYVKSGITEWIQNWKKNGWKTANKKEVKNKELWTELDSLSNSFEIKWSWVKAHSSDKLNNEVDLLARTSANI